MSNQIYTQATQPPNAYNPYQQQQPSPQHQSPYGAPPQQFNQQPPQQQFQSPQSPPQSYMAEKATPPMQYQQPQPMQGMTVAPGGGNRNVKNLPMDGDGREWSHGLCDCCSDAGTCILAWCCPCIVYAQNKQRYEYLTSRGIPDPERGGSGCTGDCWVHGLITGCFGLGWVMQIGTRGSIRSRYRIKGSGCGDCCAAWCCTPCELTQESRELELEEKSFGR
ncbi:hypothetical protein HGRIS_000642 [Hohenbuehelia grisea]|uniref:PLAC8-domain-containing protein n=1 Tax=Hohenbuehelia grisea TaxID=104357 RepID=A0ABR3JRS3_9AGAR